MRAGAAPAIARAMDARVEIPLIEAGEGGALAVLAQAGPRAQALVDAARRMYTPPALVVGDALSRRWLERSQNPYRREIFAVAEAVGRPGVVLLNVSYEWACTTLAAPDPSGLGNRLLRTLDWPFHGLGRTVVVARETTALGPVLNVTWPGSVGVLTAMAPGRFAAAINQAPMIRRGLTIVGDWLAQRARVWRSNALPPMHLLRRVVDTARDYAEARAMLVETELALPCFFTLSGVAAGDGCVIERLETKAVVHDGAQACVANDWLDRRMPRGRARGHDNPERRARLVADAPACGEGFAWLRPPILNGETRLAVTANAARGTLAVLGLERDGPATHEFRYESAS